jgi:hypothetical protein
MARVGFAERKRSRSGSFLDLAQIEQKGATRISDIFRGMPGLRVQDVNGQSVITSTRSAGGGCVNYFVDRSPWQSMYPGDVNEFLQVGEIAAAEVYNPSSVPAEFQVAGSGDCATIVLWTKTYLGNEKP